MQSVQLTATSLDALIGGAQSATTAVGGKDGFASLMDIVGAAADKAQTAGADMPRDDGSDKKPLAAMVENREPIRADKPKAKDILDKAVVQPREKLNEKQYLQPAAKNARGENTASNAKAGDDAKETPAAATQAVAKNGAATEASAEADSRDELQEKISNRIDVLSSLMNMLSTLLAKANGVIAQVTMTTVTTVQVNMEAAAIGAAGGESTVFTSPMSQANMGVQLAGDTAGLLANTHHVLNQIQQLLQADKGQGVVLTPEAQARLDTLNQALAQNLEGLKALFADRKMGAAETAAQLADMPQLADAKDVLKNDITQLRELLQKLHAEQVPVLSKPQLHTEQQQTQHTPVNVLSADTNVLPKHRADERFAFAPVIAQTVVQVVDVPQQTVSTYNNTAMTVQAIAFNSGADGGMSGGQYSGQQQGQGGNPLLAAANISSAQSSNTASNASATHFSSVLNRASQASVSEQVIFQVKTALGNGSSKIHIQLAPEELGKVDIKLHVNASGKTGVVVTTDTQAALDILQKDSQGLQKALADAGLKTDSGSLSFNLRGGQHDQSQRQHADSGAVNYRNSSKEEDVTPVVTRNYVVLAPDGLDISI